MILYDYSTTRYVCNKQSEKKNLHKNKISFDSKQTNVLRFSKIFSKREIDNLLSFFSMFYFSQVFSFCLFSLSFKQNTISTFQLIKRKEKYTYVLSLSLSRFSLSRFSLSSPIRRKYLDERTFFCEIPRKTKKDFFQRESTVVCVCVCSILYLLYYLSSIDRSYYFRKIYESITTCTMSILFSLSSIDLRRREKNVSYV